MGHTDSQQVLGAAGIGILVNKPNVIVRNVTVTAGIMGYRIRTHRTARFDGVNASSNSGNGIDLESSSGVDINGSEVSGNGFGIYLQSSTDGMTLTNSRVTGNSQSGIYFYNANGNTVYNNYFNNANNVNYYPTSGDIWNTTLTPGTNIVGGFMAWRELLGSAGRHGLFAESR